jgi:hypothetical protein
VNAEQWNAVYPVGTLVFAYPGCRPEFSSDARRFVTKTRTEAKSVGLDRDGVVWVEDHGAYIALTHVDPVSESVWQAAKQADETVAAVAAQSALPVPVGDQPQPLDDTRLAEIRDRASKRAAALTAWLDKFSPLAEGQREVENAETVLEEDVPALLAEVERLKARVAELEAERHTTNEALSDAAETLRANRDRIAELERKVASICRCDEPGADPYSCEAKDCTGEFSELNPFGGSRPVNEPSAEVSRKCTRCGWHTSVWHVDDGSAEEELHGHITRVHGTIDRAEEAS